MPPPTGSKALSPPAVVGHVEWVEFVRVDHLPAPGEIVHALESWAEPGGGGAVAAVQLARLAGSATLFTALGDDPLGHRAKAELEALGLRVEAAFRPVPQRRALTLVDGRGERTIVVLGSRLGPSGGDPLAWDLLEGCPCAYYTAGDREALARARRAGVLVATSRVLEDLKDAGVPLDALVGSALDPSEAWRPGDLVPVPGLVVRTRGADGGDYHLADGQAGRYAAQAPPGPEVDTYGCGDSFAAGLTWALGQGLDVGRALEAAARCGAACLTGRGPYSGQLRISNPA